MMPPDSPCWRRNRRMSSMTGTALLGTTTSGVLLAAS